MPILREWNVFYRYSNGFNKEMPHLEGKIYNDTRFLDGSEVVTSTVLELKEGYAKTRNTEYILE